MPGHHRRLLGRLEDRGVARHQRRDGHAGGDRQREVPGRDDHGHAARQVLGEVGLAGDVAMPGLRQADHLAGVELAEVDRLGDVAVGLGPGLAALVDLPRGQLEPAGSEDRRRADQDRGAVAGRQSLAQAGCAARAAATARSACSAPAIDVSPTARELWLGIERRAAGAGAVSTSSPPMISG